MSSLQSLGFQTLFTRHLSNPTARTGQPPFRQIKHIHLGPQAYVVDKALYFGAGLTLPGGLHICQAKRNRRNIGSN